MRILIALMIFSCVGLTADAAENNNEKSTPSLDMKDITINKVGRMEINTKSNNGIQAFRNGVDITINGAVPEDNFSIKAYTILFTYASPEDTEPMTMELSGNVVIKRDGMVLHCKRGSINLKTEVARFFEVSRVNYEGYNLSAEEVEYDMDKALLTVIEVKGLESKENEKAPAK